MCPSAKPWQKAAINPESGVAVYEPNVVANIIKQAKKPMLIIGAMSLRWKVGDELYIETLLKLARAAKLPVIATAHSHKYIVDKGITDIDSRAYPLVNLINKLEDEQDWDGFDGEGKPDLIILAGITTYYVSQMLAVTKNFSESLQTLTIDREYQSNARFSLGNLNSDEWKEFFDVLISKFN
ncbi:MAG: CO dehydrogenase/acetyl-CoA synthase complex subunit epsilon [Promethearchaeota archaeon]